MLTRIDEKGKTFTKIIRKDPVTVRVTTSAGYIKGDLHLRPSERIIDLLNNGEQFVAVTDVTITFLDSSRHEIYAPFIVLNREEITWITPIE